MITYTQERWREFVKDAEPIFALHWREIALDQERIPMGMNGAAYQDIDDKGMLHIVAVRDEGKLIGYHMGMIVTHPHYKDAGLMATTDLFYILPEYRNRGGIGARMILAVEGFLRERKVVKAFIGTKLHQSHAKLLKAMGWTPTDLVFSKLL